MWCWFYYQIMYLKCISFYVLLSPHSPSAALACNDTQNQEKKPSTDRTRNSIVHFPRVWGCFQFSEEFTFYLMRNGIKSCCLSIYLLNEILTYIFTRGVKFNRNFIKILTVLCYITSYLTYYLSRWRRRQNNAWAERERTLIN